MSEKLVAGLVTAAVVAPICASCILGPAFIASLFAGVGGWFAGLETVAVLALAMFAGVLVFGIVRRRRARTMEPLKSTAFSLTREHRS